MGRIPITTTWTDDTDPKSSAPQHIAELVWQEFANRDDKTVDCATLRIRKDPEKGFTGTIALQAEYNGQYPKKRISSWSTSNPLRSEFLTRLLTEAF